MDRGGSPKARSWGGSTWRGASLGRSGTCRRARPPEVSPCVRRRVPCRPPHRPPTNHIHERGVSTSAGVKQSPSDRPTSKVLHRKERKCCAASDSAEVGVDTLCDAWHAVGVR